MRVQLILCAIVLLLAKMTYAADLYVGAASVDMTPELPVLLQGQFNTRTAYKVETPIFANALALESRDGEQSVESVVLVSVDMCTIGVQLLTAVEDVLATEFPQFDAKSKLILTATHTHTSLVTSEKSFIVTDPKTKPASEILDFIAHRIAQAVQNAWNGREKSTFSYGLGHAVVAYNRRSVYSDGHAVMYGNTNDPTFRKMEGMEDHDVGCMFFWNESGKLQAIGVNVSCPSQEVEGNSAINADYWAPVRESLKAKYGEDVVVLGLCGAAGDLSPHIRYRQAADDRMTKLRKFDRLHEIARRIVNAVDEVYPVVEPVKTGDVPLVHKCEMIDVPQQKISKELCERFRKEAEEIKTRMDADPDKGAGGDYARYNWTLGVVKRFESQQGVENPTYSMPAHVVRIGDLALATNPFELYTDFGIQMKARSRATQLFVVQLCGSYYAFNSYVPSQYATQGGGYGAIPQSNPVGVEGGQLFTERTIELINSLF